MCIVALPRRRKSRSPGIAAGAQHTGVTFTEAGLQTRWSQPLGRDWLLGELRVGHFWRRPDATATREGAWGAGGTLTIKF